MWWLCRGGLAPLSIEYVAAASAISKNGGRPVRTCLELANRTILYERFCLYLPGHSPEGTHIVRLGGLCGVGQIRRPSWPGWFRCAAARESISAGPALSHCPCSGVRENGRVAKACDPSGTVLVDQNVCLKHGANVSCATQVYEMEEVRTVWRFPWTIPRSCMRLKH